MFCAYCGNKMDDEDIFCCRCGSPIETFGVDDNIDTKTVETVYGEEFSFAAEAVEKTAGTHSAKRKANGWIIAGIATAAAFSIVAVCGLFSNTDKAVNREELRAEETKKEKEKDASAEPAAEELAYEDFEEKNDTAGGESDTEKQKTVHSMRSYELNYAGVTASVKISDVSLNEEGKLSITITGEEMIGAQIKNGTLVVPYQAAVIIDGDEIDWDKAYINQGIFTFAFDTSELPDSIILYTYGNKDAGIEVRYSSLIFGLDLGLDKLFG